MQRQIARTRSLESWIGWVDHSFELITARSAAKTCDANLTDRDIFDDIQLIQLHLFPMWMDIWQNQPNFLANFIWLSRVQFSVNTFYHILSSDSQETWVKPGEAIWARINAPEIDQQAWDWKWEPYHNRAWNSATTWPWTDQKTTTAHKIFLEELLSTVLFASHEAKERK